MKYTFSAFGGKKEKITIEIPDDIISQASEIAEREDCTQYICLCRDGSWVTRDIEDPETDTFEMVFFINADGELF